MIIVVDYGVGNLGSIMNMLKRIGQPAQLSKDLRDIENAEKIILPGVGAFNAAFRKIRERNLFSVLNYAVLERKVPVLGICLGMQLMMDFSEEGNTPGFGWINGMVSTFKNAVPSEIRVPHMGWNDVIISNNSQLSKGLENEARFYFVHSFYVKVSDERDSIMKCNYGVEFDAAVNKKNIFGVQFHPEKSHKYGMKVLDNFCRI